MINQRLKVNRRVLNCNLISFPFFWFDRRFISLSRHTRQWTFNVSQVFWESVVEKEVVFTAASKFLTQPKTDSFRAQRIWANLNKNDRVGDGNRLLHLPHPILLQVVCLVPQRWGGKLQHNQQRQQQQYKQQHDQHQQSPHDQNKSTPTPRWWNSIVKLGAMLLCGLPSVIPFSFRYHADYSESELRPSHFKSQLPVLL